MSLFFINQTYLTLLTYREAANWGLSLHSKKQKLLSYKFKPGCRIVRTDSKMSNINTLMCTFFLGGGGRGDEIRNRLPNSPKRAITLALICNIYLFNIMYRRFVQVPGFKTVRTWIENSLFLSDISPEK